MKTRLEKLLFLNQYMQGKATAEDLLPPRRFIKMDYGDRVDYFIDGKKVTQEEFEQDLPINTQTRNITLNIRHPRDGEQD